MITYRFAIHITEKIKYLYIYIFFTFMVCLGIIINHVEPYPNFNILFPVLVIMSLSTLIILKYCLKIMIEFKKQCDQMQIFKDALEILLINNKNNYIFCGYASVMVIYFLCLYNLKFIELNIMGFYILVCGVSTLGMALIAYEIYIRSTITLHRVAIDKESLSQNYNKYSPSNTEWLQKIHQLNRVLKNASLVMGVLFVFESTMIFFANINKLNIYISNDLTFVEKMYNLPLEFWLIWLLICISIILTFPIVAIIQSLNMKKIIHQVACFYNQTTTLDFEKTVSEKNVLDFYILMNLIQNVEISLHNKYLSSKYEKLIIIITSMVTCLLHSATFINLFI